MGEWRYTSTTLDLSIRWRLVVSFMPLLLHPWGICPWYLLDRKLCEPHFQSGCHGEETSFDPAINDILVIQSIAHDYINSTIPTPLHLIFDKYFILIEIFTPFLHSSVAVMKIWIFYLAVK
jgi:hypothetical protein